MDYFYDGWIHFLWTFINSATIQCHYKSLAERRNSNILKMAWVGVNYGIISIFWLTITLCTGFHLVQLGHWS